MPPSLTPLSRALALVLLALGLAVGCGGGDDKAATTITYWVNPVTLDPEQHLRVLEPLLEEFTDETGIEVDVQVQDWAKVFPKIVAAVASGTLPDLLDTGSTWAPALQATGAFTEFDDAAFEAIGGRDKFLATSLAATGVPGPTSAVVPMLGQAYGLIYNTKLFAEAGIDTPPRTWSELVAVARKLTKPGQWGFTIGGNAPLVNVHQAFILGRQHGARLFSSRGTPTFDTPETRAALRRLLDLMAVEHVIDPVMIEKNGLEMTAEFAKGTSGMMFQQSSVVAVFDQLGFSDFAVAPVPVLDPLPDGGAPVQSIVAGTNLAVSKDSKHHDEALELVEFLTSTEVQRRLNDGLKSLPVLKSLVGAKEFSDPARKVFGEIQAHHSEPMPLVPEEGAMETALGTTLVKLWPKAEAGTLTDADIRKALRDAEALMPRS